MKLDADKLDAEVKAHDARMKRTLWASSDRDASGDWATQLNIGAGDPERCFLSKWQVRFSRQAQPQERLPHSCHRVPADLGLYRTNSQTGIAANPVEPPTAPIGSRADQ